MPTNRIRHIQQLKRKLKQIDILVTSIEADLYRVDPDSRLKYSSYLDDIKKKKILAESKLAYAKNSDGATWEEIQCEILGHIQQLSHAMRVTEHQFFHSGLPSQDFNLIRRFQ